MAAPRATLEPGPDTLFLCHWDSTAKADFARGSAEVVLRGGKIAPAAGRMGGALDLGPEDYAEIDPKGNLSPAAGTILFWFCPRWTSTGQKSHTFLSWGWKKSGTPYAVLSDGWWELTGGAGRTYFNFHNASYAHTSALPGFKQGQWIHLAVTWSPEWLVLYANGERIARNPRQTRPPLGLPETPVYLGADLGADSGGKRRLDGLLDEFAILSRALTKDEIQEITGRRNRTGRACSATGWRMPPAFKRPTGVMPKDG
ncbi:MAG: LamG domain-containing protein [Planctomycetes bacterium]|nr:LamG domain-containing protein [Planctomycetota bacterium]